MNKVHLAPVGFVYEELEDGKGSRVVETIGRPVRTFCGMEVIGGSARWVSTMCDHSASNTCRTCLDGNRRRPTDRVQPMLYREDVR